MPHSVLPGCTVTTDKLGYSPNETIAIEVAVANGLHQVRQQRRERGFIVLERAANRIGGPCRIELHAGQQGAIEERPAAFRALQRTLPAWNTSGDVDMVGLQVAIDTMRRIGSISGNPHPQELIALEALSRAA